MNKTPNQPNPEYRVVVRAVGADGPAIIRLRRWFETQGLRSLGLVAVSVEEVKPANDAGADHKLGNEASQNDDSRRA